MNVVILKYNAGNVMSVSSALKRAGIEPVISDDPELILAADKVIFPGVGEAGAAMHYLRERKLDQLIVDLKQPVLGICLGMQLMCGFSEESATTCLGIFDLKVKQFSFDAGKSDLKVPHMGWNTIRNLKTPLFKGISEETFVYFVHSYYVPESIFTIAKADYGFTYSAAIHRDNFYAVQFHPEKSSTLGQNIIQNFLDL